jgi:hypothetical protein
MIMMLGGMLAVCDGSRARARCEHFTSEGGESRGGSSTVCRIYIEALEWSFCE